MVCPPLKCTCTPYLLHVFFTLSLRPWWYGTTMYKFWLLLLLGHFRFVVLLCLFLLGFWIFSFALCMAHVGYLHFLMHWTDVVLLHATKLDLSIWWLLYGTRYQPHCIWMVYFGGCPIAGINQVWVGFLNTDGFKLPSSAGVIKLSRNGIDPSSFSSSQVNFILGWMKFRCVGSCSCFSSWL